MRGRGGFIPSGSENLVPGVGLERLINIQNKQVVDFSILWKGRFCTFSRSEVQNRYTTALATSISTNLFPSLDASPGEPHGEPISPCYMNKSNGRNRALSRTLSPTAHRCSTRIAPQAGASSAPPHQLVTTGLRHNRLHKLLFARSHATTVQSSSRDPRREYWVACPDRFALLQKLFGQLFVNNKDVAQLPSERRLYTLRRVRACR